MHRLSIVAGALLAASTAAAPAPRRNGSLTRHAIAELALGRLPGLRCMRLVESGVPEEAEVVSILPNRGNYYCDGFSTDSSYRFWVEIRRGSVTMLRRSWWLSSSDGPRFADSVTRVMAPERGAAVRCRTDFGMEEQGSPEGYSYWGQAKDAAYVVELRTYSRMMRRRGDEYGWFVALGEHNAEVPCIPA